MTAPSWLPRARDVTAVTIGVLVAVDALMQQYVSHYLAAGVAQSLAALAGAVALWWRRSRPVAVTVLGIGLCVVAQIEWIMIVGLVTLAIRRRDRVLWGLSATSAVAMGIEYTMLNPENTLWSVVLYAVPQIGFCTLFGCYIGMRRDAMASLRERAERAEAEQEIRAEQGRLAERTRIAREMHDVLAHRISLIALHAGGLEVTAQPTAESVRQTAGLIRQTARTALEDLRDVLGVLASGDAAVLAPQPRFADIGDLVARSAAAGVPVRLAGLPLQADVPDAVGRAAYRVVQESLTNIHKHAAAARTSVRLAETPGGELEICVENEAPSAAAAPMPGSGLGLAGLRERVEVVGGRFEAGSTAAGGFRVRAWLPLAVAVPDDGAVFVAAAA